MNPPDSAFRAIEQWKASLITMPDARFFCLMRGIFGTVQSPFNKQRLLDELADFISNKDVQETIAGYIDSRDHKIIAAIAVLNEPALWDLGAFFSGEISYAELDSLTASLEERLIIYTVNETGRLSLNPLLKNILLPIAADNAVLFPCAASSAAPFRADSRHDIILAAFLTFLSSEKQLLKLDGSPRKDLLRRAQKIFPPEYAELFINALRRIGLLPASFFNPVGQKLQEFARLTEAQRFAYCAAGVYISLSRGRPETYSPQKKVIRRIAAAALSLHAALDADKCCPEATLRRLIQVIQAGQADTGEETEGEGAVKADVLLEAMEKASLLSKTDGGYCKRVIGGEQSAGKRNSAIRFESDFSFVLLSKITFSEVTALAPFCEVTALTPAPRFRITREAAARAFNRGVSGKIMAALLKRMSPEHDGAVLEAVIAGWEKRHSEIIVMEGVCLVLSEEQRHIAQSEAIAPHIIHSPLPGVYLLDFAGKDAALSALRKGGAAGEPLIKSAAHRALQSAPPPSFISLAPCPVVVAAGCTGAPARARPYSPEECKRRFFTALDALHPSQTEREKLTARIEQRLIVSPRQLTGAEAAAHEKRDRENREARGLDYAGKLALVKDALLSNESLEIIVQDSDRNEQRITGVPAALEKSSNETILSVKQLWTNEGGKTGTDGGDSGCIKIAVGKIRLIRRINQ